MFWCKRLRKGREKCCCRIQKSLMRDLILTFSTQLQRFLLSHQQVMGKIKHLSQHQFTLQLFNAHLVSSLKPHIM